jgi:outer membrane protein
MKKFWLNSTTTISMMLLTVSAFAQQKNEFTVKQAVEYATKNATQVKNALLDVKIQEQVNRQITAAAYPQLSASVGLTDYLEIPTSLIPAQIFGGPTGTFEAVKFGTKYNANGGFDVSQLLFDGQVFVGLKARSAVLDFYVKTTEVTQEQIKANVMKIYYQLVVGQSQLASLDANIERFEKLLKDTKEIYKNGFAEKLDVDKVQVQLNNIKTEKEKIVNIITSGNSGLKFLLGMPQKEELVLTDTLSTEALKDNILNENYDYKDRKEIQLLTVAEKLGNYNVRRYKLSKLPTAAAFGSYSKNAQRNKFDFFGKGDWFTTSLIGVKISVPIFDGNRKNALIQQSRYELQKTQNNIEQLKQSVDYDVAQSRIKMTSALITMDNQKQNITLAENVYNTTKKKYEQGLGSNQEIYNAQTELKVAQTNYYSSLYDAISAKIDWLKAVGKL